MFRNYRLRNFDFKLILMILALSAIGILIIGSAKESLQAKQIFGVGAGFCIMMFLAFFDYKFVLKFYWLIYVVNLGLLLWVAIAGDRGGSGTGAQRWLEFGGIRFQPSELAKILLILFFAQFIMKYKEKLNSFRVISAAVALIAVPWYLIEEQPDLSTSIIVLVLFCVIMFVGGLSYKIIFAILAVAIPAAIIFISLILQPDQTILEDYQRTRILAFLDPETYVMEEAYQQNNSVIAIGSGQLDGKGYKNNEVSSVKNGNYILEPQTDFIFAVIGEEFGFKGTCLVVVLIVLIGLECLSIARRASDTAGMIIAAGMGTLVVFQSFVNIAVTTFLLPNTGLPLPFVSYGLTSVMSLYIGMGFVLNVRFQARNDREFTRESTNF
ncbi:MAG: rod shape-determining protein RodA [Lachnospiraceae bacterium]|nr:rod shape-determining protein RodA [Lachnospiraceae bacterium]